MEANAMGKYMGRCNLNSELFSRLQKNIEKILDDLIVRSIIPLKEKLDADIDYD